MQMMAGLREYPHETWLDLLQYDPNNLGKHLRVERICMISLETAVVDKVMNDIEKERSVS